MNQHGTSNRRMLARLGESTSKMLTFQDMMDSKQESGRPSLRMHRSTEHKELRSMQHAVSRSMQHTDSRCTQQAPPVTKQPKPMRKLTPADICLPPLNRGVLKSYSSPPVLSPRQDEIEWQRSQIEVAPGYYVSLCGVLETMYAFQKDCIVHTECTSCSAFLYCIDSASMVLCPTCRSIGPVEANASNRTVTESLGLGLTVEHLMEELGK